jgi:hypothetical protein
MFFIKKTAMQCISSAFFGLLMVESMYRLEVELNFCGRKWAGTFFLGQFFGYAGSPSSCLWALEGSEKDLVAAAMEKPWM